MMKRILLAATVASLPMGYALTLPAIADDATTLPPAPTDQGVAPTTPSGEGVGTIAAEPAAAPPPAEAVIPAQRANEVRAENLIGTTVFSPEGEKVGVVKDILFDTSGKATGLVLSVGGIMGLGAKSVGLTWDEVDVQPEPKLLQVNYTEEQLEAAPTFKTQEAQQAESEAQQMQSQQPAQPPAPASAPAPAATE
ncbi:PRC-barrel domain-containing protein [Dongia rigui]|uniref:PRC-barrel domain-containing protein n=1 Tax=Dongia rigui TaxID=940149 RepID=A0ABU5DTD3_9PROT|nr:PRC-barrel domain-containing protein [Dongia rigui]MDY0870594.1 PRC-barrel domain-containing protein [Dongia rigui]